MMEKVVRHADEGQQRRLVWVQIVLCAVGLLLVGRLAWYQLFGRIAAITQSPEVIAAVRGSILDINGHYLATSTYACNVFFRPDNYDKPDEQARLRERLAVTATVVAGGMTFEEGEMPQGFVERLAEQLIDPKTGAPRALAGKLADTLADRELLTMSLVEEMSAARSGRAADLRAQALAAGGAMDNSMAAMLSEILNEPLNDMERIVAGSRNQRHTVSVGVAESQCRAIADLGTDILITEFDFQRIYPDGSLASHILGFVNFAGEPQYGLEFYYDSELSGENGLWQGINHPSGSRLMAELGGYREAEDGSDLILSLDRNVQYEAERILRETVVSSEAESGSLLVLDSRTGAVIAMANSPTFEPGRFWDVGLETLRNGAISTIYEPGSVIKPLTIAAALDARVIYPDTTYMDEGVIIVGEQEVRNSDLKAHGETSMTELLAYSLNVGAAHVASILGPARFYEMFKRFGFSDPTGIDLTAEERGIMRVPGQDEWHLSDLGRNSYGQGMSATPLQVAAAFGALANGGMMRRPHVVAAVSDEAGTRIVEDAWSRQVVSPQVAEQVTEMLVEAVQMGMPSALVPGYTIAGKSGTSQVAQEGRYIDGYYIGSFVGYGPMPDPRFVVLVKLDGLTEGQWGGEEAGPAFADMFQYLMRYEGIPPND
ncbi:MAG: penicillin-binding protein 2 [Chloroflexi bacterium]|nr:penicillin-binding protein 2 [Chloroflexota bacterium]